MSKICLFCAKRPVLRDYLYTATTWKIDFLAKKYKKKFAVLQAQLSIYEQIEHWLAAPFVMLN